MSIKRVAAINDLSGMGKCSLSAAISILAAMGVQACPIPTAVLSNQTGYDSYYCVDFTQHMLPIAEQWKKLGVSFNGIYTGFLNDTQQIDIVKRIIDIYLDTSPLVLVDPVLGDNGKLYSVFDKVMCDAVKVLIQKANVITPNLTEACILADASFTEISTSNLSKIYSLAKHLTRQGPSIAVITGVHREEFILNVAYNQETNEYTTVKQKRIGTSYSGTGDILSSIVCGTLINGGTVENALKKAVVLFEKAITQSVKEQTDPNDGIAFESYLQLL